MNNLLAFINAKFFLTGSNYKADKAYFCFTCGGVSLKRGIVNKRHKKHKWIQVVKHTDKGGLCYKKADMEVLGKEVFDDSEIQVHRYRCFDVCLIEPTDYHCNIADYTYCKVCRLNIKKPALYCSVTCKVLWMAQEKEKEKEKSLRLEAKNKRKEVELGGGSDQSVMKKKAKKNAAEGQESGAGEEGEGRESGDVGGGEGQESGGGSEEKEKAKNVAVEEKGEGGREDDVQEELQEPAQ